MVKEPPSWSPDAVSGTVLMEYLQRVSPQFVAAELDQLGLLEAADRAAATVLMKLEAPRRLPRKFAAMLALAMCAMIVVLAHTRLDVNKRVTKLMGVSKASFASAEEMMALTGMQVGGVTPFALPPGMPLFVDQRIPDLEWIILGGGGRTLKIKIPPAVFEALGAEVVEGLAM